MAHGCSTILPITKIVYISSYQIDDKILNLTIQNIEAHILYTFVYFDLHYSLISITIVYIISLGDPFYLIKQNTATHILLELNNQQLFLLNFS